MLEEYAAENNRQRVRIRELIIRAEAAESALLAATEERRIFMEHSQELADALGLAEEEVEVAESGRQEALRLLEEIDGDLRMVHHQAANRLATPETIAECLHLILRKTEPIAIKIREVEAQRAKVLRGEESR